MINFWRIAMRHLAGNAETFGKRRQGRRSRFNVIQGLESKALLSALTGTAVESDADINAGDCPEDEAIQDENGAGEVDEEELQGKNAVGDDTDDDDTDDDDTDDDDTDDDDTDDDDTDDDDTDDDDTDDDDTDDDDTDDNDTDDDDTDDDDTDEDDTDDDDTDEDDTDEDDTDEDDTDEDDTDEDDTAAGDTAAGDTAAGDTAAGDTAAGDTAAGDDAAISNDSTPPPNKPIIEPIPDQTVAIDSGVAEVQVVPANRSAAISAVTAQVQSEEQAVQKQFGLRRAGNLFDNWGGQDELWLMGDAGWYFVLPDGSLHQWDGSPDGATGPQVAQLSPDVHMDPSLLYSPPSTAATASVSGDIVTIRMNGVTAAVMVEVTGTDGTDSGIETFLVSPPEVAAELEDMVDVSGTDTATGSPADDDNTDDDNTDDDNTDDDNTDDDNTDDDNTDDDNTDDDNTDDDDTDDDNTDGDNTDGDDTDGDNTDDDDTDDDDTDANDTNVDETSDKADRAIAADQSGTTAAVLNGSATSPAFEMEQQMSLRSTGTDIQLGLRLSANDFFNWGGRSEKWLMGAGNAWYFITPDGSLYSWNGTGGATGDLIASLNVSYYYDISLLTEASTQTASDALFAGNGDLLDLV